MITVVTSMNKRIYEQTGKDMIESFLENWPENTELKIYYETDDVLIPIQMHWGDRIKVIDQMRCLPDLTGFVERNQFRPDQSNPLELNLGAVRFSYKSYAIFNECLTSKSDFVIWLDADTYTFNPIPKEFLDDLTYDHPEIYTTYLGRDDNYSECGFVVYNIGHEKNQEFMETWRDLYEYDRIFKLEQWHDSFVFDCVRKMTLIPDQWRNLTPWGQGYDHVFINSELGKYIDHMKGDRKKNGKSKATDLNDNASEEIKERLDA